MKKIAIVAALSSLALLLPMASADAGLWSAYKNGQLAPKEADSAYRVETLGLDVRVYEFTPESNEDVTCVLTFTDATSTMQCFDKPSN
ncbi:hypothetical protein MHM88_11205 [Epibacterium sp. MM17-32]|uniref:hypothetical protein n=1 Tax=Epibacterium sp. MM17-32 TaxID=2917734 RepID=UPI001EF5B7C9|nr:hypothetical protein [Epibacterium sp. MM17-32]MCG7628375.1 hypothetical protein [Epibacterium sp. MM17-32]